MFAEVGTAFGLLFIMFFMITFFDGISMIGVFIRQSVDVKEYATYVLNWIKIIALLIFAAIMIYFGIIMHVSVFTKIIEFAIGALLAADGIASMIIKTKFGGKRKK